MDVTQLIFSNLGFGLELVYGGAVGRFFPPSLGLNGSNYSGIF